MPNTDALELAPPPASTLGGGGFVPVNERLETSRPASTRSATSRAARPSPTSPTTTSASCAPTCSRAARHDPRAPGALHLFTDPQLGRVGLTETEARARGGDDRRRHDADDYVARALEMDESRGSHEGDRRPRSGQILGAAVLGIEGGEIMAVFEVAMMGELPSRPCATPSSPTRPWPSR